MTELMDEKKKKKFSLAKLLKEKKRVYTRIKHTLTKQPNRTHHQNFFHIMYDVSMLASSNEITRQVFFPFGVAQRKKKKSVFKKNHNWQRKKRFSVISWKLRIHKKSLVIAA
jgi:hypothetical protein